MGSRPDHEQFSYPQTYSRFFGALYQVERTMQLYNGRYADKWRTLPIRHHVYRATRHFFLWAIGNKSEPHLAHAVTRAMMAAQLAHEKSGAGL